MKSKNNFLKRWWHAFKDWLAGPDPTEPTGNSSPNDLILSTTQMPWGEHAVPSLLWGMASTDNYHPIQRSDEKGAVDLLYLSTAPSIKNSAIPLIRFPGGQLANFYHPGKPHLGIIAEETEGVRFGYYKERRLADMMRSGQALSQEAIQECIRQAKGGPSGQTRRVIYTANILWGDALEALRVIRELQKEGIVVVGIELSNELFMGEYREVITIGRFVEKANLFVQAIQRSGIDIPIYVPVAHSEDRGGYFQSWNDAVRRIMGIDGVVLHDYSPLAIEMLGRGDVAATTQTQFRGIAEAIRHKGYLETEAYLDEAASHLPEGSNRIAITEWGIKNQGQSLRGTILDAHYLVRQIGHFARYQAETGRIACANLQSWFGHHELSAGVHKWDGSRFTQDAGGWIMDRMAAHLQHAFEVHYCSTYSVQEGALNLEVFSNIPGTRFWAVISNLSSDEFTVAVPGRMRQHEFMTGADPAALYGIKGVAMTDGSSALAETSFEKTLESGQLQRFTIRPWEVGIISYRV